VHLSDSVGRVGALWRYPVKSMQGEQVHEAAVSPDGLEGDRQYAVCDAATGRLLSAKSVADLLLASARFENGEVLVTLPDGLEVAAAGDDRTDAALSAWLGREVRLQERATVGSTSYEMTFDPPNDDAELVQIPTPPHRLFDLATLHLLSTTSLERLEHLAPGHQWDVRRFRPNLLVDSAEAEAEGFVDEEWVGRRLVVGSATLEVQLKTVRCAMPLREQPGLARDVGIYKALDETCANHLGVYVEVQSAGRVAVGDAVHVT
jgi:uncharacterized protein YcbX